MRVLRLLLTLSLATAADLAAAASQCDFNERYEKKGDRVVFHSRGAGKKMITSEVEGLNAKDFKPMLPPPITGPEGQALYCNRVYATDGRSVFYRGEKIPGVDPVDFQILPGGYARTRTELFFGDVPVPGAKSDKIKILSWGKATDGNAVFKGHQRE